MLKYNLDAMALGNQYLHEQNHKTLGIPENQVAPSGGLEGKEKTQVTVEVPNSFKCVSPNGSVGRASDS